MGITQYHADSKDFHKVHFIATINYKNIQHKIFAFTAETCKIMHCQDSKLTCPLVGILK